MRRLAGCVLALGLLAQPALAQRAGLFSVEGRNADGTTYTGTLETARQRDGAWQVTWRVGPDTIRGIGFLQGDLLAVAYAVNNQPGIVVFRILSDGRLDGPWTMGDGIGQEVATPR